MNAVQDRANLNEKTVQKAATNAEQLKEIKRKRVMSPGRPRNSRVKVSRWSDGVDSRVVAAVEDILKKQGISHTRVLKVSATEVIIKN